MSKKKKQEPIHTHKLKPGEKLRPSKSKKHPDGIYMDEVKSGRKD